MPTWTTLKDALASAGSEDLGAYACSHCGRRTPSDSLVDVRAMDDVPGTFVCLQVCASQKERELIQAEVEAEPWPTELQLNDLRGWRDLALAKSDWTELPSNRARLGEAACLAWDQYREACRSVVAAAKEGTRVDLPTPPI